MGAEVGLCTSSWERLGTCYTQSRRRDAQAVDRARSETLPLYSLSRRPNERTNERKQYSSDRSATTGKTDSEPQATPWAAIATVSDSLGRSSQGRHYKSWMGRKSQSSSISPVRGRLRVTTRFPEGHAVVRMKRTITRKRRTKQPRKAHPLERRKL